MRSYSYNIFKSCLHRFYITFFFFKFMLFFNSFFFVLIKQKIKIRGTRWARPSNLYFLFYKNKKFFFFFFCIKKYINLKKKRLLSNNNSKDLSNNLKQIIPKASRDFIEWFVGFTDAEGCFLITSLKKCKLCKLYIYYWTS